MSWRARESYLKGYAQWRKNREIEILQIKEELREIKQFLEMLADHLWRDEKSS